MGLSWHQAQRLATAPLHVPVATAAPTITPTPTSMPGPPELLQPEDGALLPQPVAPQFWYFVWSARDGPCHCYISIQGPGGLHISQDHIFTPYEYRYTTDRFLPDDALGPWSWGVSVQCPLGSNYSESRTFWVKPAQRLFLPLVQA